MTDATRQKALRDRKIAQGLKQVLVWVPRHRVEKIREIAAKMRDEEQNTNVPRHPERMRR